MKRHFKGKTFEVLFGQTYMQMETNKRETPLERKGSEEPIGNADSEQLFNIFWSVISVRRFLLHARWEILCGVDLLNIQ